MTTQNPFDGREHGGLVFLTNPERCFYIGLSPSQQKQWLRDHPERWQTREDALRDLQARAGTDVEADRPRRARRRRQMRCGLVARPTVPCRPRVRTSGCLTSRRRTPRR